MAHPSFYPSTRPSHRAQRQHLRESDSEIARRFSSTDDRYNLPATIAAGAKVHSTHRKQSGIRRHSFLLLAAIILTPCVFGFLATHLVSNQLLAMGIYVLGFVAGLGAYLLVANYGSVMGHKSLVRSLKAKLAQEQVSAESWDGIFVGFSPAAVPKIYELNTNWDVGCLFIRSDRLCYIGEETRFALRREHIAAISLAPGFPGLLRPRRVFVAWKDDEAGRSGTFNIGSLDGSSALALRRDVEHLFQGLDSWRKSASQTRALPPQLADLVAPDIGKVTAGSAQKMWKPRRLFTELLWTAIFASVGAVLFGLPFHLIASLIPVRSPSFVAPTGPGAGWYVIAAAVGLRVIALVPALTYKERPAVAVPSLDASTTAPKVQLKTEALVTHTDTEPVAPR
jgi:hypothetical protein